MDGFEVTIGALREAGGAAGSMAADAAALPLAQAAAAVGEALPGGVAATAALAAAEAWRAGVAAMAEALAQHTAALCTAADAYGAAERAAVTALAGESRLWADALEGS